MPFLLLPASAVLSDPVKVDATVIVVFLVAPVVIIAGSLLRVAAFGREFR